jgi:chemotaxis protein methyltransferase CheR
MVESSVSHDEFMLFSEYFYRKTGISFDISKRYFVDKRLIERMEITGHATFRNYFTMMRFEASGEELQHLTNTMTVNETYFIREEYQFECLVNSILPEIVSKKTNGKPIRIWVMPSSSGEEPYSIAMYLLEKWTGIDKWDIEIIASDIDTAILKKARTGRYAARSLQYVPKEWLQKYFTKVGPDFQIADELRSAVEYTRVNLAEPADTRSYRNFDVIFCRNLLIYFDDLSRKTAGETFYDALVPDGYILLGHSESMSRISSLYKARRFPEAIVYQRAPEAQ